jgi:hypothetical protein
MMLSLRRPVGAQKEAFVKPLTRIGLVGVVLAAATVGAPAQASPVRPAVDFRSCTGNATPPIEFYDTSTQFCMGGTVGTIGVHRMAFTMHSGGYYGNFEYIAADGSDHTVDFRPNEVHGIGANSEVWSLAITPPF